MSGEESEDDDTDEMASRQSMRQQMAELEEKTDKLKVDMEEEEFKKEERELNKILEESEFLKLAIPGPIETVAKYCNDLELIRLAATSSYIRNCLNRDCKRLRDMNKKLDLEKMDVNADKQILVDVQKALPGLVKIKLGTITSSRIMKYLGKFKKLRQIEMTFRRNYYFSGDRINVDHLKLRSEGGSNKGIVQLLNNFRGLKSLTLYRFRLRPDLFKAINRHKKSLTKLAFIDCKEKLKVSDDPYIYGLTRLKTLKIINLFNPRRGSSFESRYVKNMPHQLQTFECDHIFQDFDVEKMKLVEHIKIQYCARSVEDHQGDLVEFIEMFKEKPLVLLLQDRYTIGEIDREILDSFLEMAKSINPLIQTKTVKTKY